MASYPDLFPLPSADRIGWPWEKGDQIPQANSGWPKVTIITPSYNQGQFLEETIRSVLMQGYPNLEYMVIDGGSTDQSVDIIQKYEPWIDYWVSEPDRGQAHAINKGLARATGDLIGWVNSDDILVPGCLMQLASVYPEHARQILAGDVEEISNTLDKKFEVKRVVVQSGINLENFIRYWESRYQWHQVGLFFPAQIWKDVGLLDETLDFGMDYDLLCRFLQRTNVHYLKKVIARFRLHSNSKTVAKGHLFVEETSRVSQRYWHLLSEIDTDKHNDFKARELLQYSRRLLSQGEFSEGLKLIIRALKIRPQSLLSLGLAKIRKL